MVAASPPEPCPRSMSPVFMTVGMPWEGCSMDQKVEKMLERLADRLGALLKKHPDWQETADQLEASLESADLEVETDKSSPKAFATSLFENNPKLSRLAETALKNRVDLYQIDSPFDLVNNLLPSDHHLD